MNTTTEHLLIENASITTQVSDNTTRSDDSKALSIPVVVGIVLALVLFSLIIAVYLMRKRRAMSGKGDSWLMCFNRKQEPSKLTGQEDHVLLKSDGSPNVTVVTVPPPLAQIASPNQPVPSTPAPDAEMPLNPGSASIQDSS